MDSTTRFITIKPPFGRIFWELFPSIEQANPSWTFHPGRRKTWEKKNHPQLGLANRYLLTDQEKHLKEAAFSTPTG